MSFEIETHNSELLFVYGAKLCNPNGDPDDENRPRMDYKTNINLVSDVRLKRYFRDYVADKFGEDFIWVTKIGGNHVSSDKRLQHLKKQFEGEESKLVSDLCIDARLFGATIPIRAKKSAGAGRSESFTGPVQFSWGFSLHPVEMVESSTITSIFVGREARGEEAYGTMGKDWRLYYSMIAFYGVVSGLRAKRNGLRKKDVKLLDNLIWEAVKSGATTRSKIGQEPHLYMRVEYNDGETFLGDFRKLISRNWKDPIRNVCDVTLNYSRLIEMLNGFCDRVETIYIRESGATKTADGKSLEQRLLEYDGLRSKIRRLPHPEITPRTSEEYKEIFVVKR